MRAVNLIPAERRRGGAGSAGRSGGGAYVVLGTLAGLVLMAVLWAVAHQQAADRRTQAAQASAQASSAEARSSALAGYRQFADLRNRRERAIAQLVAGRFDWALVMREVATALPADVRLLSFTGSLTPGAAASGAGAPPPPVPASSASAAGQGVGPSVQLTGCASGQSNVAEILRRLRAVPAVADVALSSSVKGGSSGGSSSSGASTPSGPSSSGQCPPSRPTFALVVSFTTAAAATGGPATAPPASGQPTAGAGQQAPPTPAASSTPPAGRATTVTSPTPNKPAASGARP
ncbi:MAG: hypothetical protein E6G56_11600 [Actinobacteria bacterium]|nr:MAG: hypothetical protein E6G56_11600 [Actinomycetota bacterium]